MQPKGIIATEAFVSLPFCGVHLLPSLRTFEFELDTGEIVPGWSLRKGMRATPVVTTGGGLYRYRIEDILEVTGRLGRDSVPAVPDQAWTGIRSGWRKAGGRLCRRES